MANRDWIDITMTFGHPAGTWPGDAVFTTSWTGRIGDGTWAVNLSQFCSSPHNGTHSDAPLHVIPGGAASESLDPDAYLGPCRVIDATQVTASALPASLADRAGSAPRILFKTRLQAPGPRFPASFKGVSVGLAQRLVEQGTVLVGSDAPSMDAHDSSDLAAHKVLFRGGCTLLENLDLSKVRPGDYELVALPLKVSGLCAAPVRALLRPA